MIAKSAHQRKTQNDLRKQPFTTMDLIGLVALVAVVGTVSGAILAETVQADAHQRALRSAENLSHDIWSQQSQVMKAPTESLALGGRGPSSAAPVPLVSGSVAAEKGVDPWGNPYHFLVRKVLESSDASHPSRSLLRVTVWSDGPNGKPETDLSRVERERGSQTLMLGGDDIGSTHDYPDEL